jgi:putative transposase
MRKKTLDERWHSCACGCELDRDAASAKVILDLGRKHLSVGTRPTSVTA